MKRANIVGGPLAYDVVGAGRPLVLLHAFPFDHRIWERLDVPGRQLILPDLRGFGETPLRPYVLADLADDVASLLDALGLARATIGGLSMGGYVALAFAARHPGRLEALILADTKAGPDSPEARQAREESIALVRSHGVGAYVDKQLPRLLAPAAGEPLRDELRRLGRQAPEGVIAGLEALRDRPDRRSELSRIACPALVIVGSDDVLTPPSEAQTMATALPNARLVQIVGAGHLSPIEAPAAFSAALLTLV